MSLRLEMLQVARLAPSLLGDSAALVRGFLERQQNANGGFRNRDGRGDIYYTVFGLEALIALQAPVCASAVAGFLRQYQDLEKLDFVHLCCLARSWGDLVTIDSTLASEHQSLRDRFLSRMEAFRSGDGGYNAIPRSANCTAYACFLATGAIQDCQALPPNPAGIIQALERLRTRNGGYSNDPAQKIGGTNATAAAVGVFHQLGIRPGAETGDWLMARAHAQGGFLAVPHAPMPDLLSTATALHALATLQRDLNPFREKCLDFLDSLWTNEGAFFGSWSDHCLDCEYTYYALLALGHLAS